MYVGICIYIYIYTFINIYIYIYIHIVSLSLFVFFADSRRSQPWLAAGPEGPRVPLPPVVRRHLHWDRHHQHPPPLLGMSVVFSFQSLVTLKSDCLEIGRDSLSPKRGDPTDKIHWKVRFKVTSKSLRSTRLLGAPFSPPPPPFRGRRGMLRIGELQTPSPLKRLPDDAGTLDGEDFGKIYTLYIYIYI